MATTIQIKRTNTNAVPQNKVAGELVYVFDGNGTSANKEKLFIGNFAGTAYQAIGGKHFTDLLEVSSAGTVTADKALIVDSNKKLNELLVDNLSFDARTIASTDSNGDVNVTPNGTGFTVIKNPKISIDGVVKEITEFVQDNSGGTLTQDSGATINITYNDSAGTTTLGIADAAVDTAQLKNAAVNASKLAADAVETAKIKDDAVTGVKILDGTITSGKIGLDQINNTHLADNAVAAAQIQTNAVTSDKIGANQVTGAKIAADAIDDTKIADLAVKNEHLADDAVGTSEIANLAVTGAKIAATTIASGNIALGAIGSAQLATGAVRGSDSNGGRELAASTITVAELANNAVETNKIKNDAVTTAKIADLNVTEGKLEAGAVATTKIKNAAVTEAKIAANAVDTAQIKDAAVTENKILDAAIAHAKLATDAVERDNIKDGEVIHAKLAADAVEGDNIKDGVVTAGKIAANTITANEIAGTTITASEIASTTITGAKIANATITNDKLVNNSIKLGSTTITLSATAVTDVAGLTSLAVDNISVNGNTVATTSSTNSLVFGTANSQNISMEPNGNGTVVVPTGYTTRSGFTDNSVTPKSYVDAFVSGLAVKDSAKCATTTVLPNSPVFSSSANTLTAGSNGKLTIDGHDVLLNERVLVKDQSNKAHNGLYTLTTLGVDGSAAYVLTRATDADTGAELKGGSFVFVELGTANSDSGFVATHDGTPTLNNSDITFTQFSGAGLIVAGAGIDKTGNTLSVKIDDSTVKINGGNLEVGNAIANANIASAAAIAQAKLAMNAAGTRTSATGITQANLGLASFDSASFSVVQSSGANTGFVQLSTVDGGSY